MNQKKPTQHTTGLIRAVAAGLLVAQAVASLQVRQSNLTLHAKMQAVLDAGFLAVPDGPALMSLESLGAALWGGLFFTLSIGAILTLATIAAARMLPLAKTNQRLQKYAPALIWAILVAFANLKSFDLYLNLYLLLIPPPVYALSRRRLGNISDWRKKVAQTLPVLILAALWLTQYDQQMFIDIRDRLLLSNPVGEKINQFYYRYTLYPAEAFKAPSQKIIRTSRVDSSLESANQRSIKDILARFDWLPVKADPTADLWVRQNKAELEFVHDDRIVVLSSISNMTSRPGPLLNEFAQKTDRHGLFRTISFYGLLLGFPVLLYIGLYTAVHRLLASLAPYRWSTIAASAICLLLGILVWLFFQHGRTDATAVQDVARALASDNWRTQVVALRQFREKGLDVKRMPAYPALKSSSVVPVRYWLVEALAASSHPQAFGELVAFLDDPSLNVRTRACEALGYRSDRRAIPELLSRLKRSDQWYFQWYAYRAIKALGWKQTASD